MSEQDWNLFCRRVFCFLSLTLHPTEGHWIEATKGMHFYWGKEHQYQNLLDFFLTTLYILFKLIIWLFKYAHCTSFHSPRTFTKHWRLWLILWGSHFAGQSRFEWLSTTPVTFFSCWLHVEWSTSNFTLLCLNHWIHRVRPTWPHQAELPLGAPNPTTHPHHVWSIGPIKQNHP